MVHSGDTVVCGVTIVTKRTLQSFWDESDGKIVSARVLERNIFLFEAFRTNVSLPPVPQWKQREIKRNWTDVVPRNDLPVQITMRMESPFRGV